MMFSVIARHARFMIAMAAVASGAIWLRLVMFAADLADVPFDAAYAVAAWACWLVPLAIAAMASSMTRSSLAAPRGA